MRETLEDTKMNPQDLPMDDDDHDFWNEVYDILVRHAGASDRPRNRDMFIWSQPTPEFRFGGLLGFGGKFWVNNGKVYISCYIENSDDEKRAIIEETNAALRALLDRRFPACGNRGCRPRNLVGNGLCQHCFKEIVEEIDETE